MRQEIKKSYTEVCFSHKMFALLHLDDQMITKMLVRLLLLLNNKGPFKIAETRQEARLCRYSLV